MKQPIFIISKPNLFEAWLLAKRTADKTPYAWNWGGVNQYKVLSLLQALPDDIAGYCSIPEVVKLLESCKCHYAYPKADIALQGILTHMRPLREKLHEVQKRIRQKHESRSGYFQASFEGTSPSRPHWGYIILHKKS